MKARLGVAMAMIVGTVVPALGLSVVAASTAGATSVQQTPVGFVYSTAAPYQSWVVPQNVAEIKIGMAGGTGITGGGPGVVYAGGAGGSGHGALVPFTVGQPGSLIQPGDTLKIFVGGGSGNIDEFGGFAGGIGGDGNGAFGGKGGQGGEATSVEDLTTGTLLAVAPGGGGGGGAGFTSNGGSGSSAAGPSSWISTCSVTFAAPGQLASDTDSGGGGGAGGGCGTGTGGTAGSSGAGGTGGPGGVGYVNGGLTNNPALAGPVTDLGNESANVYLYPYTVTDGTVFTGVTQGSTTTAFTAANACGNQPSYPSSETVNVTYGQSFTINSTGDRPALITTAADQLPPGMTVGTSSSSVVPCVNSFGHADSTYLEQTTITGTPTSVGPSSGELSSCGTSIKGCQLNVTWNVVQPTTTTLSAPAAVQTGDPLTVTASVADEIGTAGGTVSVTANGSAFCTITLSGGTGSCQASAPASGSTSLVGSYDGGNDAAHNYTLSSTSASTPVSVVPVLSIPSGDAPLVGQPLSFSRIIATGGGGTGYSFAVASGSLPPGVTLNTDGSFAGAATTTGTTALTIKVSELLSGVTLSRTLPYTFQVSKAPTSISLHRSPAAAQLGTSITYTATVLSNNWLSANVLDTPSSPAVESGTVTITVAGTTICTVPVSTVASSLVATGVSPGTSIYRPQTQASCTSSAAPIGKDQAVATYSGNSQFASSTQSSTFQVAALPATVTTPTVSPTTITGNQSATFSATVAPSSGTGTPTGTVTFFVGGLQVCQASLSAGSASCTAGAPGTATGALGVSAVYSGDASFSGSQGATTIQVAPAAVPGAPTGVIAQGYVATTMHAIWGAPSFDGGSPVQGYDLTVTSNADSSTVFSDVVDSSTVDDWISNALQPGSSYTLSISAVNAIGQGPAATYVISTPPSPTSVTAVPGNAKTVVTWALPATDSSSCWAGYCALVFRVTATPVAGGAPVSDSSVDSLMCTTTCTDNLTGLTNNKAYTITVTSTDDAGSSTAASATGSVTPRSTYPVVTSASTLQTVAGGKVSAPLTAGGTATGMTWSLGGAPSWLKVVGSGAKATLKGTVPAGTTDSVSFSITATNGVGADTQFFTLNIGTLTLQTNGATSATANLVVGQDASPALGALTSGWSGTPTLTETGALPAGVTFVDNGAGTGGLTGSATGAAKVYPVTITASEGGLSVKVKVKIVVELAPKITTPASTSAVIGKKLSFTVKSTGSPNPTVATDGTQPSWLTATSSGTTLKLVGTPPAGSSGTYVFSIVATSAAGTDTQNFTVKVS